MSKIFFIWNVKPILRQGMAQYRLSEITLCSDLHGLLYFIFSQTLLNVSAGTWWNCNWVQLPALAVTSK